MTSTFNNLPGDVWMTILREWIDCPHAFARLDIATCNRKFRPTIHNAMKGHKFTDHVHAPRPVSKARRLLLWLISRKLKIIGLTNLEVSYAKDIAELLEDYPEIGKQITTLSLRKTVTGTRNMTGMDQMPRLLMLLPNLSDFQSTLGNHYSPTYNDGPHYVTLLPTKQITHLSEEIGQLSDLDRILGLPWPALKSLTLNRVFLCDNIIFDVVATSTLCSRLTELHIHKFDEFQEVSFLPTEVMQWYDLPEWSSLTVLTMSHWNQQAQSNNATHAVLSNFFIHRSPHLQQVTLEGRYITNMAVQHLLFNQRKELTHLTLKNSCETLDQTCVRLSALDYAHNHQDHTSNHYHNANLFCLPKIQSLVLENMPLVVIQSLLLPLTASLTSVSLTVRDPPKNLFYAPHTTHDVPVSVSNSSNSSNSNTTAISFPTLSLPADAQLMQSWEEVYLENLSLSVSDAKLLLSLVSTKHHATKKGLKSLQWLQFTGFSESDMIAIFTPTITHTTNHNMNINSKNVNYSRVQTLRLQPALHMAQTMTSTMVAEAVIHWLCDHHTQNGKTNTNINNDTTSYNDSSNENNNCYDKNSSDSVNYDGANEMAIGASLRHLSLTGLAMTDTLLALLLTTCLHLQSLCITATANATLNMSDTVSLLLKNANSDHALTYNGTNVDANTSANNDANHTIGTDYNHYMSSNISESDNTNHNSDSSDSDSSSDSGRSDDHDHDKNDNRYSSNNDNNTHIPNNYKCITNDNDNDNGVDDHGLCVSNRHLHHESMTRKAVRRYAPLRVLSLSQSSHLQVRGLTQLIQEVLTSLLQVQIHRCGQIQSSDMRLAALISQLHMSHNNYNNANNTTISNERRVLKLYVDSHRVTPALL